MRDHTALEALVRERPAWARKEGPLCDVITSSRLRLARNLDSLPFPRMAMAEQAATLVSRIKGIMPQHEGLNRSLFLDLADLSREDRLFLMERRLISRDLAQGQKPRGVLVAPGERFSIMVNEEDHLRFQVILPGLQLGEGLKTVSSLESSLEGYLGFAYQEPYGYLTACPTNVGTGLRASVLVHLPGLVLTRRIGKLLKAAQAMSMAVRGYQGEGSEVVGNFIQISNQTTLGLNEHEIIRRLEEMVHRLIQYEEEATDYMWNTASRTLEDKVFRAWGTLSHARSLTMEEVMSFTSALRLGHRLKFKDLPSIRCLNEITIAAQPAHLERWAGKPLDAEEGCFERANRIRGLLEAASRN